MNDWGRDGQRMHFLVGDGDIVFSVTRDHEGYYTAKAWRTAEGGGTLEALDKSDKFVLLDEAKLWCETYKHIAE